MNELHLVDTSKTSWGRPVFRLERHYRYLFRRDLPDNGKVLLTIRVPRGFETDVASIPRPLWWLLSPWGPWRRAAVIHDYLCTINTPRFLTDAVFRHVMEEDPHIKTWQRIAIYYGVRTYWVCIGRWFSK